MYINLIFLPLIGSLTCLIFGRLLRKWGTSIITTLLIFLYCIFYKVALLNGPCLLFLYSWMSSGMFTTSWEFFFNILTVFMFIIVTVWFLFNFFSISYMYEDSHIILFLTFISFVSFFLFLSPLKCEGVISESLVEATTTCTGSTVVFSSLLIVGSYYFAYKLTKLFLKRGSLPKDDPSKGNGTSNSVNTQTFGESVPIESLNSNPPTDLANIDGVGKGVMEYSNTFIREFPGHYVLMKKQTLPAEVCISKGDIPQKCTCPIESLESLDTISSAVNSSANSDDVVGTGIKGIASIDVIATYLVSSAPLVIGGGVFIGSLCYLFYTKSPFRLKSNW